MLKVRGRGPDCSVWSALVVHRRNQSKELLTELPVRVVEREGGAAIENSHSAYLFNSALPHAHTNTRAFDYAAL